MFVHNSVDGDSPAAMRYTEARMSKLAEELLRDLDKETVPFVDNYDGSLKEPNVLPSAFPNLLVNGSTGIAVGMATNIPPHNMTETCMAVKELIHNPEVTIQELIAQVSGPDFPTGGIIQGTSGIKQAYATGRGKVRVKAKMHTEQHKNREALIITEIPYMINKSQLLEQIVDLVRQKRVEGISDIRDESDRQGMRVVIELKQGASAEVVQNMLYKHSRLQDTFSMNMLSLVDNQPKTLNLKEMLEVFLRHRQTVVRKRTEFDLKKAAARAHILEGLLIALKDIENVVQLIRKSATVQDAHAGLISKYALSEEQATAILEMRLSKLASLERDNIRKEHEELLTFIKRCKEILSDEAKILNIIDEEMDILIKDYGDKRRTLIEDGDEDDFEIEDLIEEAEVIVTISNKGYVKRTPLTEFKVQNRGGKGVIGSTTREGDFVEDVFIANTHAYLLSFTDKGKVHWTKVWKIPEASRQSMGKNIVNIVELEEGERVTSVIPVRKFDEGYLMMVTKRGIIKKTALEAYSRPRNGGIKAIILDEGDELIGTRLTMGNDMVLLATKQGMAVRFNEEDARPIGRTARGVRGIRLKKDDEVVGVILQKPGQSVLTLTETGYGKRTDFEDYRLINRGGQGVRNIICSPRNGKVVAVRSVADDDDLIMMSRKGSIIRMKASQIRVIGRNTQGLRVMRLSEGDVLIGCAKIVQENN
ncbi:MAG: DNA gyrase subunit A [Candidatus Woesearchaeota archaeon]